MKMFKTIIIVSVQVKLQLLCWSAVVALFNNNSTACMWFHVTYILKFSVPTLTFCFFICFNPKICIYFLCNNLLSLVTHTVRSPRTKLMMENTHRLCADCLVLQSKKKCHMLDNWLVLREQNNIFVKLE